MGDEIKATKPLTAVTYLTQTTAAQTGDTPTPPPPHALPKLRVAVIDNFDSRNKVVDIDGDGSNDLSHGTFISEIIKSYCPEAEIVEFPVSGRGAEENSDSVIEQCNKLGEALRRGEQFDAANLSLGQSIPISKGYEEPNTKLVDRRKIILENFRVLGENNNEMKKLYNFIRSIEENASKIPFYVASGNEGPRKFNLTNLAEGTKNCGAKQPNGAIEKYSAQNSLITNYGIGTFEIRQVDGGYDINDDGKPDILRGDRRLSGQPSRVSKFVGKKPEEAGDKLDILFPVDRLPDHEALYRRKDYLGDYFEQTADTGARFGYRLDRNGKIIYDPLQTGHTNVVNFEAGTSWVGPILIGQKLAEKQKTKK